jgi:hypothetical protein
MGRKLQGIIAFSLSQGGFADATGDTRIWFWHFEDDLNYGGNIYKDYDEKELW